MVQILRILVSICIVFASSAHAESVDKSNDYKKVRNEKVSSEISSEGAGSPLKADAIAEQKKHTSPILEAELNLYRSVVSLLAVLISAIAVVFGVVLAINLLSGQRMIKESREELKEMKKSHQEYNISYDELKEQAGQAIKRIDKTLNESILAIKAETKENIEEMAKEHFNLEVVRRYKEELIVELGKDTPSTQEIYYRLSDAHKFPDASLVKIYRLCIEKFHDNADIMHLVNIGLQEIERRNAILKGT